MVMVVFVVNGCFILFVAAIVKVHNRNTVFYHRQIISCMC